MPGIRKGAIDFQSRQIRPMLIGAAGEPFDNAGYLYELKWDGERCIAYLDPEAGTELRNRHNVELLSKVPELRCLHQQVNGRCILDGELVVLKGGRPDFFEIQKRLLTGSPFKIELMSKLLPASFIPFDILYYDDEDITRMPLIKRRDYLTGAVREESERLMLSEYVEKAGVNFYRRAMERGLEGIVAKKKNSVYLEGKRTGDWIKIRDRRDADFVICGYLYRDGHTVSLVLGQYGGAGLTYKGHVPLALRGGNFKRIREVPRINVPLFAVPPGDEDAVWIEPVLVCTVGYVDCEQPGGARRAVFKGLRFDRSVEHEFL